MASRHAARSAKPKSGPRIALTLGGGGARGIAHIVALEAFDELGVRPSEITGTSIGALYGAAYASGLSAKLIRAHTEEMLSQRFDLVRQIFSARAQPLSRFLNLVPLRNALLDAEAVLEAVLPTGVTRSFEALTIPLATVATDFYAQSQVVHRTGPLRPAVAASIALPVLFGPVTIDGRVLIDGGFVNPLPFDIVSDGATITVAIDVAGGTPEPGDRLPVPQKPATNPSMMDVLAASSQILQRSVVREKLRTRRPDILIECPVENFTVIDFLKWREVLDAARSIKTPLKTKLERILARA